MSNFVSNSDATTLFEAVGKKKLTVTDTMPTAAAGNVGVSYLYLGADTQDFEEGGVYKCQEVTPETDPKTYEYAHVFTAKVDLSLYKRIFGGTVDAWDLLTDDQKAQYDYAFFDDDADNYLTIVDTVEDGNMHAVTSNAVAEEVDAIDAEISDIVNVYGSKNLLPNDASTLSKNGLTFTVNTDGSININGTASADTTLELAHNLDFKAGMILSGCASGGATDKYYLAFEKNSNPYTRYAQDNGAGAIITTDSSSDNVVYIRIRSGQTLLNLMFYPMVRASSIKDDTYEPYAATNKQLTENKMSYADNSILGAKNLWDISSVHPTGGNGGGSASYSNGVITVNCPAVLNSGAYITGSQLRSKFANLNGLPIIISFDVKGDSSFNATVGPEVGGTAEAVLLSTSYMHKEYLFNGAEDIKTLIFYTQDATQTHTITVTNFMLRIATDNDSTYESYAMTNRELTEEAKATYQFNEPSAASGPLTINKTFTITEPGVYLCYGQANPYAAESSLAMRISKNGTEIKRASNLNMATNVYSPISCATITECNVGDTINFYCENAVHTSLYNALFVVKIGKV